MSRVWTSSSLSDVSRLDGGVGERIGSLTETELPLGNATADHWLLEEAFLGGSGAVGLLGEIARSLLGLECASGSGVAADARRRDVVREWYSLGKQTS